MKEKANRGEVRFRKIGIFTIAVVYLLILVGGIVRSTGAGMGCPDWPKCFGNWVPPTHISQLPEDYQQIYSQKRALKNQKFSAYLDFFGLTKLADKIRHDESILNEAAFNSTKTWTEYFNRLLGATTGFLIIATFISALAYVKKDKTIPVLAFFSVLLVIFQGWIGSIVVSTNLLPWMITFHMLLALLLVALLIYIVYRAFPGATEEGSTGHRGLLKVILLLCLGTLIVQIAVGTQVREAIDEIALAYNFDNRNSWIGDLGMNFYFHRSFSILIVGLHIGLVWVLWKNGNSIKTKWALALLGIVGLEILFGVIMAYFSIPAFAQPIHLLLSSLMFGIQFLLLLMVQEKAAGRVTEPERKEILTVT